MKILISSCNKKPRMIIYISGHTFISNIKQKKELYKVFNSILRNSQTSTKQKKELYIMFLIVS